MRRRDHERIIEHMHGEIQHLRRQNAELLDRMMYLSGSTWTPPPTTTTTSEPEPSQYQWNPEQELDAVAE